MLRGADGYLWISAHQSLIRFDGVRFTVFDSSTTPAMRGLRSRGFTNFASELFQPRLIDSAGAMWIRGPGGSVLNYRDGRFSAVVPSDSGFSSSLQPYRGGFIAIRNGRLYRLVDKRLTPFPLPASVPDTGIWDVAPDTGRGLWVGTYNRGLWHASGATAQQYGAGPRSRRVIQQTSDGVVWAIGSSFASPGVWRYARGRWSPFIAPDDSVQVFATEIIEGLDGWLWFRTSKGVLRWRNGVFERFRKRDGLSSDDVHALVVDPEGVAWVATAVGLDRLRPRTFVTVEARDGLPYDVGQAFALDSAGGLWSREASGSLYHIDGGAIRGRAGQVAWARHIADASSSQALFVQSRHGGMWLAPRAGGLVRVTKTGKRSYGDRSGLPNSGPRSALEARDGTVWIKSGDGFGRFTNGNYYPIRSPSLQVVGAMAEDGRGRIWIANPDGFHVIDRDSVSLVIANPSVTRNITATSLALESGDTLWAALYQPYLVRIVAQRATVVAVPALADILAESAEIAVAGRYLWIGSRSGIARVQLADLHRAADGDNNAVATQVFTNLDGLSIASTASIQERLRVGHDGRVWVATPNGFAVADPALSIENRTAPRAHVEEIVFGADRIALSDGENVPPSPDRVEIHFTAISSVLPERVRIQYRLDGADESWVDAVRPSVATYTRLGPGRYTFRVRAWNEDGVPSIGDATLGFRVLPAWYESGWFFVLALLAFGSAVVAWHRDRTRRAMERVQAKYEATLAERTRLAGELHDTLLQAFTGVTLQLQALRGRMRAAPDVEHDLGRVLGVADGALREARSAVWDMRAPELEEGDVAAALEESVQDAVASHRFAGGAPVHLEVTITGDRRRLSPAVETAAHRIGREAVANALRHADAKHVRVAVAFESRHLCVDVRDDGVGFDMARLHPTEGRGHWGLVGMRERARNARGTLDVNSAPGAGTAVLLRVPVDSA
jgi:signal transduction histidine kinase